MRSVGGDDLRLERDALAGRVGDGAADGRTEDRLAQRAGRGDGLDAGDGLLDRADGEGLGAVAEVEGDGVADGDDAVDVLLVLGGGDLELEGGDALLEQRLADAGLDVGGAVDDVADGLPAGLGLGLVALGAQGGETVLEDGDAVGAGWCASSGSPSGSAGVRGGRRANLARRLVVPASRV